MNGNFSISSGERRFLLASARETIAAKLEGRRPDYARCGGNEAVEKGAGKISALEKPCGAFVTLHLEQGGEKQLRGCIGRMTAQLPLEETVRRMAVEAAFGDPRFPPLSPDEFRQVSIEISALSPLERCDDPRRVRVGIHGIYLIHQGRAGVFLPQVPVEQGWNLEEYLYHICLKAGLPPGSCDAPGAELYTFTAVVFGEEQEHKRRTTC
jgi:AmmeMemoRadiSam system protein A